MKPWGDPKLGGWVRDSIWRNRSGISLAAFGVAIALVLLLILFTLALSIVLKPRGRDMPPELSELHPATARSTIEA